MGESIYITEYLFVKNGVYIPELFTIGKRCSKCKEIKPLEEFAKDRRCRDGRGARCKECVRIYQQRWAESSKNRPYVVYENGKKTCSKCGEEKNISEFPRDSKSRDGLHSWCKQCVYSVNLQRYYDNYDEHRARNKRYYEEHKETHSMRSREWAKRNPEKRRRIKRRWRNKHREAVKRSGRRRYRQNREARILSSRNYILRKRGLLGSFTTEQWDVLCELVDNRCLCCGGRTSLTVDHIIPITWGNSSNWIDNIQPLCLSCNAAKGNRHDTDYRPDHIKEWARTEMEGVT